MLLYYFCKELRIIIDVVFIPSVFGGEGCAIRSKPDDLSERRLMNELRRFQDAENEVMIFWANIYALKKIVGFLQKQLVMSLWWCKSDRRSSLVSNFCDNFDLNTHHVIKSTHEMANMSLRVAREGTT